MTAGVVLFLYVKSYVYGIISLISLYLLLLNEMWGFPNKWCETNGNLRIPKFYDITQFTGYTVYF